jgi:hypothetical protein
MSTVKKSIDAVLNYGDRLNDDYFDDTYIQKEDLERQYKTIQEVCQRMNNGFSTVMLADDVGMGKTYVGLGVLANYLFNAEEGSSKNVNSKKFLIVTPPNKILQNKWVQEIQSFYENAGVKEDARDKLTMRPVIVDGVHALLKLSMDAESHVNYKQIREHSDIQLLFTYVLYQWAKNRKIRGSKGQGLPQSYTKFGPFFNLKGRKSHYFFADAYDVICEYSLKNYFDDKYEKDSTHILSLIDTLTDNENWWLLNREIKNYLAVQDDFEPNIFIIGMNKLGLISQSTSEFRKHLSTLIMNHALSGCEKPRRNELIEQLYDSNTNIILMPSDLENKRWCDNYLGQVTSMFNYLGMNDFINQSNFFQENKRAFREGAVEPTGFLKQVVEDFIDYRLENANFDMCIVDEVHNWKSGTSNNASVFQSRFSGLFNKKLVMSATPIQLGIRELKSVFSVVLSDKDAHVKTTLTKLFDDGLMTQLESASAGFKKRWDNLIDTDYSELSVFDNKRTGLSVELNSLLNSTNSQTLRSFIDSIASYKEAVDLVQVELSKIIIRHVKNSELRAVQPGNHFNKDQHLNSVVKVKHKLYVTEGMSSSNEEMTLFECISMRLGQILRKYETSSGQNSPSARLLNGLNSSFEAYKESNTSSKQVETLLARLTQQERQYYDMHVRLVDSLEIEHPKVKETVDCAFDNWKKGEKTLIFCTRVPTVEAIEQQVNTKIINYLEALDTQSHKIESFAKDYGLVDLRIFRLYLRIENHDFDMTLAHNFLNSSFKKVNSLLSGFDITASSITRRKLFKIFDLLAFQRFSGDINTTDSLKVYFSKCFGSLGTTNSMEALEQYISPSSLGSKHNENSAKEDDDHEEINDLLVDEESFDEDDALISEKVYLNAVREYCTEDSIWVNDNASSIGLSKSIWTLILNEFGRIEKTNPNQILGIIQEIFSGLLKVTVKREDLIIRYLSSKSESAENEKIISGLHKDKFSNETQADKVINFLTDLVRSQGTINPLSKSSTKRQGMWRGTFLKIGNYKDADRQSTPYVKTLMGKDASDTRLKRCDAFNSPLPPDVLVCTSVGSEGIDLHRYCRHIIHHDVPWNPASLEQKTGRIDRVNSLAERLNSDRGGPIEHFINVGIPFLGNNYDQYQYDVLVERAQKFEVLFGDPEILQDMKGFMDEGQASYPDNSSELESAVSSDEVHSKPLPDSIIDYLSIDLSCVNR